jgi:ferredoxin
VGREAVVFIEFFIPFEVYSSAEMTRVRGRLADACRLPSLPLAAQCAKLRVSISPTNLSKLGITAVQMTAFENFLHRHDAPAWEQALTELRNEIHEVDREATEIWLRFYPLSLHELLSGADDAEALARKLLLEGDYRLATQINTSHRFLYAHRFWAQAKRAVQTHAESATPAANTTLAASIREINSSVAAASNEDASLTLGITFVSVMTLRQTGLAAFAAAPEETTLDRVQLKRTPAEILRERARDDGQGLFGFLKTENKTWTVTFDENSRDAKFKVIHSEEIASGAARDMRDWTKVDPRRSEGPIPVQCRAAACGTCWVGVLGGSEKLSPVSRLEGTKIKEFGYINTDEERPLIRLACMAQATGAVSVVIPPWNGFFGKIPGQWSESQQVENQQVEIKSLKVEGLKVTEAIAFQDFRPADL